MLNRATIAASVLLLLIVAAVMCITVRPYPAREGVGATEESIAQVREGGTDELSHTIQQTRSGGSKDFWIDDRHMGRTHHRIESSHSVLTAQEVGKQLHLTEQIFNMKGYFQEKVERDIDMQHVRYVASEEGLYHYSNHRFETESLSFSLFRVPGSILPLGLSSGEAFLRGIAEGAIFSLFSRTPSFHARILRANVQQQNVGIRGETLKQE